MILIILPSLVRLFKYNEESDFEIYSFSPINFAVQLKTP